MGASEHFRAYIQELEQGESITDFSALDLGKLPEIASKVIYAYDYHAGKMLFTSGFDHVLGYPSETVIDPAFIIGFVHPDDQPIVANLSQKSLEYSARIFKTGVKPWQGHLSLDYRIRRAGGQYIRVLRESVVLAVTDKGLPVSTLSIMTDIDHIKHDGNICAKMFGPEAKLVPIHSILESQNKYSDVLSRREIEILQHLGLGMPSFEIAEKLFLSTHTVNNHRKNMLRKTGLKNTADLVRFGLENGLV